MVWTPLDVRNALDGLPIKDVNAAQLGYMARVHPSIKLSNQPPEVLVPKVKNHIKSEWFDMTQVTKNPDGTYSPVPTPKGQAMIDMANENNWDSQQFAGHLINLIGEGRFPKDEAYGQTLFLDSALADADYMAAQRIALEAQQRNAQVDALKNQVVAEEAARAKAVQDMQTQLDAVNTAKTQLIDGVPNLVTLGVTAAAPVGVVSLFGSDQEPAPYLPKYPPPPQNPYYRGSYY